MYYEGHATVKSGFRFVFGYLEPWLLDSRLLSVLQVSRYGSKGHNALLEFVDHDKMQQWTLLSSPGPGFSCNSSLQNFRAATLNLQCSTAFCRALVSGIFWLWVLTFLLHVSKLSDTTLSSQISLKLMWDDHCGAGTACGSWHQFARTMCIELSAAYIKQLHRTMCASSIRELSSLGCVLSARSELSWHAFSRLYLLQHPCIKFSIRVS